LNIYIVSIVYSCYLSTEQILEDSGTSVAPPKRHHRSGQITLKGQARQEVSRDRRGSDISGDSGSEYQEEEESGGEDKSEDSSENESDQEVSHCGLN
jgi:hypothetical protein